MSRIQLKITHHTNNQENHNFELERPSTDVNTEMTHVLEFSDKNFKAAIILKMLQQAITHMFETQEKIENLRKGVEV